ncbi:DNA-binding MurR/RpiR family transcriptional regulator [Paraburkholderia sp. MM5482-R2]
MREPWIDLSSFRRLAQPAPRAAFRRGPSDCAQTVELHEPSVADGSSPRDAALAQSLELEIGAIRHVYELARSPAFARVAERMANADAVYILGIQSTRGISNAFYSYLEYIRPRVFYSDGMSGSYVDSLISAVVERRGPAIDERVARNRELQSEFDQFDL